MRKTIFFIAAAVLLTLGAAISFVLARGDSRTARPAVKLARVPDRGIQPQVAAGADGTINLVYFKGDAAAGDVYYTRLTDWEAWSQPIRVNSSPGSAVALGNIRGARIATGRRGRVYVVWNGSQKAAKENGGRFPLLFSRLNANGTAFEPERNLIRTAYGLDGGSGIAADRAGRVYVFWHAPKSGGQGEASRTVWVARSLDDGATFEPERPVWNQPTGACGCCSLDAATDLRGSVYVLFRSARELVHRDMYLLTSDDHGTTFAGSDISAWNVGYCVMSAEAFAASRTGMFAAWETEKHIRLGIVAGSGKVTRDKVVSGDITNQKYPALAVNRGGDVLIAWTEGMGWKRGGSVHWQLLNAAGKRIGNEGGREGVPAWSLVACYALRTGGFVVLY